MVGREDQGRGILETGEVGEPVAAGDLRGGEAPDAEAQRPLGDHGAGDPSDR